MGEHIKERARIAGKRIAKRRITLRKVAKELGVSKTTVHKDVSERLRIFDPALHHEVRKVLDHHKKIRAKRGGTALKRKIKNDR